MSYENKHMRRASILYRAVLRLQDQLEQAKEENASKEYALNLKVISAENEMQNLEAKILVLRKNASIYAKNERVFRSNVEKLTSALKREHQDNIQLASEKAVAQANLDESTNKVIQTIREIKSLQEKYKRLREQQEAEREEFQDSLRAKNEELVTLKDDLVRLDNTMTRIVEEAENDKAEILFQTKQIHDEAIEKNRKEIDEQRREINFLLVERDTLKSQLSEVSDKLNDITIKEKELRSEVDSLKINIGELETERNEAIEELRHTKSLLKRKTVEYNYVNKRGQLDLLKLREELSVQKGLVTRYKNAFEQDNSNSVIEYSNNVHPLRPPAEKAGWPISTKALVKSSVAAVLVVSFGVFFATAPNSDDYRTTNNTTLNQTNTQRSLYEQELKAPNDGVVTSSNVSTYAEDSLYRSVQPLANRPSGEPAQPSTNGLELVSVLTPQDKFRTFSLPEYLLEVATNQAVAQSAFDDRGANYRIADKSVDAGNQAASEYVRGEINSPSVSAYLNELIRTGKLSEAEAKQLAVLSSLDQGSDKVSLQDAVKFDLSANSGLREPSKQDEEESTYTYYGEFLKFTEQQRDERQGRVPHSNDRGGRIGSPAPSQSQRHQEYLDRRFIDPQYTLETRAAQDANELALYSTVKVNQRIRTINYTENDIPIINVAKGNIINIAFLDKFGNPYPIADVSPREGNGIMSASIKGDNSEGVAGNIVEIRGLKLAGSTVMSVLLAGRATTTSFEVNLTQDLNDTKLTVMMPKAAPGFESVTLAEPTVNTNICKDDFLIETVLHGVIPQSLSSLDVSVSNMQIYTTPAHAYIKSNHEVTTGCECLVYGVEGLNVCRVSNKEPLIEYMNEKSKSIETLSLASMVDDASASLFSSGSGGE